MAPVAPKKATRLLVSVSMLALSAFPAFAQTVQIDCTGTIGFGEHVACSAGSIRINPDGTINTTGCLVTNQAADPIECKLSITGGTATKSVQVSFDTPNITVSNGGQSMLFDRLRMQEQGDPFIKTSLIFTTGELTSTITIDVGGTLNFNSGQAEGNYSGPLVVNANFI